MRQAENDSSKEAENPLAFDNNDPLAFEKLSLEITQAASGWLGSMYPTGAAKTSCKDGAKHILITVALWTLPSLVLLGRLVQILCLPFLMVFQKGFAKANWDAAKFFHCIKFTVGFTALAALSVYWDDYHDLTVTVEESEDYELVTGNPPSSFAGWDLVAYVFATMPTTEGTCKKCFLRILGTCVGGFSAWALIHITGDNAIGSLAWFTIATGIGAYISVDKRGTAARFGPSDDFGYGGFYLVLTQTVIVIEYHAGLGEGDELVANRISANIIGILTAVFLSTIPPRVMGSSPKYTKLMLEDGCHGLSQAAEILAEGGKEGSAQAMRELRSSFSRNSNVLRSDARFLLSDAKRMNKLPFFHVDAKLEEELDGLTVTCAGIVSIMGQAADVLSHLESHGPGSANLPSDQRETLKAISLGNTLVDLDIDPRLGGSTLENLVASFEILQSRLSDHRTALQAL